MRPDPKGFPFLKQSKRKVVSFFKNMSLKILTTKKQIAKLSKLQTIANNAVKSDDFVQKLGGIAIFAGIVDFCAIQSARLIEQVILKARLDSGKNPSFEPHEDSYFYDKRISTRDIIKEIENMLPFKVHHNSIGNEKKINDVAAKYLKSTKDFLNYRNALLHHIGSPKMSESKIESLIQKSIDTFNDVIIAHREFFETWQPYSFGEKELKYFYGKNDAV